MKQYQIPIIKTDNTLEQQLNKVNSEREECLSECFNYTFYKTQGHDTSSIKFKKQLDFEALDLLTATLNLIEMLGISPEVYDLWRAKMVRYEVEKGYEIVKNLEVNDE